MTIDFMQAVAEDLDMELEVVTSDRDHFLTVQQAKEIVSRKNPPDYIITGNEKSNAGQIIRISDEAGIKIFLISNGFVFPKDIEAYGRPREKYKHWIGEMIPNNFSAGYQMGKVLINKALALNLTAQDGKIHIAAIAGAFGTHASVERVRGLQTVVGEFSDKVKLLQVFPGDWTSERAEKVGRGLFRRYKEVQIIWGANDTTAIGAMNAAISIGKTPGKDVLFGGCGWYAPAIQKIQEGTLTTSVGGHFMDGGWAMVLLNDYHHGKDFISDPIETDMFLLDKSNIEKHSIVFVKQQWSKIDFKKFSKVHNPSLKRYDFSLEAIFQQF
ncbi:sugar ABC transporter substrate-binding protein [Desulfoluna limicola]|uniref:Sugar ABC transporter substrate-binding protein n=2 Tax=Desulfoluna limicola TaxID=2810562 RepID=A0ABM7PHX9_9BACT|nr:sugar ABC transporter substrate-binding protein [Desulfoluna limicola]